MRIVPAGAMAWSLLVVALILWAIPATRGLAMYFAVFGMLAVTWAVDRAAGLRLGYIRA